MSHILRSCSNKSELIRWSRRYVNFIADLKFRAARPCHASLKKALVGQEFLDIELSHLKFLGYIGICQLQGQRFVVLNSISENLMSQGASLQQT